MRLSNLKEGEVAHSKVTDIFYKVKDGVLYKFPMYPEADMKWNESAYMLDESHFVKATKTQLSNIEKAEKEYKKKGKKNDK